MNQQKKSKHVVITGSAPSIEELPYKDLKDAEIWSIGGGAFKLKRCDVVFEMHTRSIFADPSNNYEGYLDKLKNFEGKIYMRKEYDDIPNSVAYPVDEMIEKWGEKFFSSVDWMLALALEQGYDKISLYGVDLAVYDEYLYQRPSAMYWIGYLQGLGKEVFIQPESGLNMEGLYAIGNSLDASMSDLLRDAHQLKAQVLEANNQVSYCDGAITAMGRVLAKQNSPMEINNALQARMKELQNLQAGLKNRLNSRLEEISAISGHSVVIPEKEFEIKNST